MATISFKTPLVAITQDVYGVLSLATQKDGVPQRITVSDVKTSTYSRRFITDDIKGYVSSTVASYFTAVGQNGNQTRNRTIDGKTYKSIWIDNQYALEVYGGYKNKYRHFTGHSRGQSDTVEVLFSTDKLEVKENPLVLDKIEKVVLSYPEALGGGYDVVDVPSKQILVGHAPFYGGILPTFKG